MCKLHYQSWKVTEIRLGFPYAKELHHVTMGQLIQIQSLALDLRGEKWDSGQSKFTSIYVVKDAEMHIFHVQRDLTAHR